MKYTEKKRKNATAASVRRVLRAPVVDGKPLGRAYVRYNSVLEAPGIAVKRVGTTLFVFRPHE